MIPFSAVLFDRDGTLVEDVPYNGDPDRVRLLPGAEAAVALARSHGLATGVISNQSGIGRGLLTPDDVHRVNERADALLGGLDTWVFCPHAPDAGCACRKPGPGLILTAAARLGVPPAGCLVIGDIAADVLAARAAGAHGILVPNEATAPAEVARFADRTAPDPLTAVRRALGGTGSSVRGAAAGDGAWSSARGAVRPDATWTPPEAAINPDQTYSSPPDMPGPAGMWLSRGDVAVAGRVWSPVPDAWGRAGMWLFRGDMAAGGRAWSPVPDMPGQAGMWPFRQGAAVGDRAWSPAPDAGDRVGMRPSRQDPAAPGRAWPSAPDAVGRGRAWSSEGDLADRWPAWVAQGHLAGPRPGRRRSA
ncbi:D-glycero-alpha-D-manno-heptose-1,7-bisphosphate 7-phosphatase [Streptomyces sp. NPDC001307]|uniref:D-glycero-alpha-D-manno-heptose-1,7-bisphosphate 7-phosphatase n=1 Tax=Streptomyces sp. NPDC001307 TaxID=3364560 RepID=UPI0036B515FF